jgi:hypothetical protein
MEAEKGEGRAIGAGKPGIGTDTVVQDDVWADRSGCEATLAREMSAVYGKEVVPVESLVSGETSDTPGSSRCGIFKQVVGCTRQIRGIYPLLVSCM